MMGFEGALALQLDFGGMATRVTSTGAGRPAPIDSLRAPVSHVEGALRLAPRSGRLTGPDKYKVLERRRRRAQIRARHLLGLMDVEQHP
jgi:hypothetical protein